jgi:hypothetical protein
VLFVIILFSVFEVRTRYDQRIVEQANKYYQSDNYPFHFFPSIVVSSSANPIAFRQQHTVKYVGSFRPHSALLIVATFTPAFAANSLCV